MPNKIDLSYTRAQRDAEHDSEYKCTSEMSPAEKKEEMEKVRYPELNLWDIKPMPELSAGDTVIITAKVKEVRHVERDVDGKKEVKNTGAEFEAHMLELVKANNGKKSKKGSAETMASEITEGLDAVMSERS